VWVKKLNMEVRMNWMNARRGLGMMVVIGASALLLGGCNDSQKADSARMADENATLKVTTNEQADELARMRAENDRLKVAPPVTTQNPAGGPDQKPVMQPQRDVVIEVAGDVLFASGQVALRKEGKDELDKIAKNLNSKYSSNRVRIEGHTDSDPIKKSKWPSNEALSQARAEEVKKYLASKSVSSDRITTVGLGATKPKATKVASRRVDIVVVGN